jgi:acetyl/propionyl-CoA carboxylase alpha subunit
VTVFNRIAVVDRSGAAVRLIRAVRELNEERGYGIRTIALHTESEQRTMFVRQADEAVCLGGGSSAGSPYLDHEELERALRCSRADAAWVGWGFVADPGFPERACCVAGTMDSVTPRCGDVRSLETAR